MKNLITIIAIIASSLATANASINPEPIITTATVEVVTIGHLDFFSEAVFETESENLAFTTTQNMSIVQIYNAEGQLEFQLPVMSNNVQINKNLFGQGSYKLGFVLEGQSEVHFTIVTIK